MKESIGIFLLVFIGYWAGVGVCYHVHKCPPTAPDHITQPDKKVVTTETVKMEITAYCSGKCCCGKWADGFFADGSPVGGKAIAADTDYYDMGQEMYVPGYGRATVKDVGGAIKGNKLDLYFSTHQEALNWGRQFLTVEIIK